MLFSYPILLPAIAPGSTGGAEGVSGLFVHHHPAPMKTIGDRKIRGGRDS
jgi:hypothetical protein